MNVETIATIAGIAVNLIALLIAVSRLLEASNATEVRNAERMTRLESDVKHMAETIKSNTERLDSDVQTLFNMARKPSA